MANTFEYNLKLDKFQNGKCLCYLPDHGDHETIDKSNLREIDTKLNVSLPYQVNQWSNKTFNFQILIFYISLDFNFNFIIVVDLAINVMMSVLQ